MKELVAVGVLAVAAMIGDHSPNQRTTTPKKQKNHLKI